MGRDSMFNLNRKQRGSVAPSGIVSHVTGDLSKKLTRVKSNNKQSSKVTFAGKSTTPKIRIRSVSFDLRWEREEKERKVAESGMAERKCRSARARMVLHSLKPDIKIPPKKTLSPRRIDFHRAVIAVKAGNLITNRVWRW